MTGAEPSMGQAGAYGELERVPTGIAGSTTSSAAGCFAAASTSSRARRAQARPSSATRPAIRMQAPRLPARMRLACRLACGRLAGAPGALRHAARREPFADARPHRAARLLPGRPDPRPDHVPERLPHPPGRGAGRPPDPAAPGDRDPRGEPPRPRRPGGGGGERRLDPRVQDLHPRIADPGRRHRRHRAPPHQRLGRGRHGGGRAHDGGRAHRPVEPVQRLAAERELEVRKFRGSGFLRGRHSVRITDDGIRVFPRIEARLRLPSRRDHVEGAPLTTGSPSLDAMLGGGLPHHSTTLVGGPSGIGKTTLGLQFLGADPGRRGCSAASTRARRRSSPRRGPSTCRWPA